MPASTPSPGEKPNGKRQSVSGPPRRRSAPHDAVLACILLVLLFILPLFPASQLLRKQDAAPLYINIDYHKDPRYFASHFGSCFLIPWARLRDRRVPHGNAVKGRKVQLVGNGRFARGRIVENVLYVMQDLDAEAEVTFEKEVYVRGSARIGEDSGCRPWPVTGMFIFARHKFFRWLDAGAASRRKAPARSALTPPAAACFC